MPAVSGDMIFKSVRMGIMEREKQRKMRRQIEREGRLRAMTEEEEAAAAAAQVHILQVDIKMGVYRGRGLD